MFVVTTSVVSRIPSFKAIAAPQIVLEYDSERSMSPIPALVDPVLPDYTGVPLTLKGFDTSLHNL